MMTWWCLDPQIFLLKSNHLLTIFIIFFPKSMGPPSLAHIMLAKHVRHAAKGGGGKGGRTGRRREEEKNGRIGILGCILLVCCLLRFLC